MLRAVVGRWHACLKAFRINVVFIIFEPTMQSQPAKLTFGSSSDKKAFFSHSPERKDIPWGGPNSVGCGGVAIGECLLH